MSFPSAQVTKKITSYTVNFLIYLASLFQNYNLQVVGIDLPSVVTTLNSIQQYCNYETFKQLQLLSMDVRFAAFAHYMQSFQPTHAACIIGLPEEEHCFLRAAQATQSLQCIAVAEKRNPPQDTDFASFGFTQTHRIPVMLAGSRKRRFVLIANRTVQATSQSPHHQVPW